MTSGTRDKPSNCNILMIFYKTTGEVEDRFFPRLDAIPHNEDILNCGFQFPHDNKQ